MEIHLVLSRYCLFIYIRVKWKTQVIYSLPSSNPIAKLLMGVGGYGSPYAILCHIAIM